jgi:hypothetical protein
MQKEEWRKSDGRTLFFILNSAFCILHSYIPRSACQETDNLTT